MTTGTVAAARKSRRPAARAPGQGNARRELDPEHPGRFSFSLVVGLAVLRCFTPEHPERGIADLADELDLKRSTTHRYASTLVTLGYLEQGPSHKYRLAAHASDVGLSLFEWMPIRRAAREHLQWLRGQTGHTVSLGVLAEGEVVYIDRWHGSRQGQYAIDAGIGVGTCVPVHCTAAGKALLAHLHAAERRKLIAKLQLKQRGPKTITTKTALRAEVERIISASDVTSEDEELLAGRRALATAILDTEGRPVAAVELATPSQAYTRGELLEQLGAKVAATAQRISLGEVVEE